MFLWMVKIHKAKAAARITRGSRKRNLLPAGFSFKEVSSWRTPDIVFARVSAGVAPLWSLYSSTSLSHPTTSERERQTPESCIFGRGDARACALAGRWDGVGWCVIPRRQKKRLNEGLRREAHIRAITIQTDINASPLISWLCISSKNRVTCKCYVLLV